MGWQLSEHLLSNVLTASLNRLLLNGREPESVRTC